MKQVKFVAMLSIAFSAASYGAHPDRAIAQSTSFEVVPQLGHSRSIGGVESVAVSANGRFIASGGGHMSNYALLLWGESGKHIRTMLGHSRSIKSISFLPDHRRIVSGSEDKTIRTWDLTDGRQLSKIEAGFEVDEIALSQDGRRIAGASSLAEKGKIWDLASGRELCVFSIPNFQSGFAVVFSPDARQFVAGGSSLRIYDADSCGPAAILDGKAKSDIASIAFSRDGRYIAAGDVGGTIRVWNTSTGKEMLSFKAHAAAESSFEKFNYRMVSVAYSADAQRIVSGGHDGIVNIWNAATGEMLCSSKRHVGRVSSVAFTLDGKSIVSGYATELDPLKIFSGSDCTELATLKGSTAPIRASTVTSDGRKIATGSGNFINIWEMTTGQRSALLKGHQGIVTALAFSADSKKIISGSEDKTLKLWNPETGLEQKVFDGRNGPPWAVAFLPSGDQFVSGHTESYVDALKLWDVRNGALNQNFPSNDAQPDQVFSVSVSPIDESILVSARSSSPNLLKYLGPTARCYPHLCTSLINSKTGAIIRYIPHQGAIARFSPNGRIIVSTSREDETTRLWNPNSGKELGRFKEYVERVSFSSDSRYIVSPGSANTITIFSVESGALVRRWKANSHTDDFSVSFSASGNQVISSSKDGTSKIWDSKTGELLASLISFGEEGWVTMTPEGFFDASKDGAKNLNVVRGIEVYSIDQVYQALYRPDLVREKLAGDPKGLVREAAAKLDLNKVIASGGAPKVSIVTPAGNVANDEATVEATIAEQNGGGIGKIEWRVNGVTLGIEARGLERLPEGTASSPVTSRPAVTVKRRLSLEPGENRIEVVAYNGRDLIASDPAQVILKWDGEKSATPPKLHVLAVGVNDYYDSRLKLSYAVPDARAIGEAMKKAGSSIYQSVEVTSVLDDGVTIENLDKVFAEVSSKVHPRDVFVFFLAGHGKTVDGRYHFLPQNFRYKDETSIVKRGIDQDRFQAWFAKIPARKSILLYDTCESGSLTGDRVQQRGIERVSALEKMTRAMGRTVLSASSDDAPALEGYRGHGVFTYALLDALQGADTNGNGLIEVTELAAFIDQQVPDLSFKAFKMRQIPQMKIVGNSFPVVSKTTVLQSAETQADAAKTSATIPTKPTHVVVSQTPVDVFMAAARGGAVVQQLPPGTLVTLVDTANGWQLIAKEGQKLGFVEEKALVRLQ